MGGKLVPLEVVREDLLMRQSSLDIFGGTLVKFQDLVDYRVESTLS